MTSTIGAFEAKTHLAGLLQRVEAGESITITKHGRPVARLVPVDERSVARDWDAFWRRVDDALVTPAAGTSIKGDIESCRP